MRSIILFIYKEIAMKKVTLLFTIVITIVIVSCEKDNDSVDDINNDEMGIGTMTDVDGNLYYTVKIGNQWWMKENLKTTKYSDGTPISNIQSGLEWVNAIEGAYCTYENTENYADTFGLLYNYYAIESGKLSPDGWRIPTFDDWMTLLYYIKSTLQIPNECDALRSYSGWWNEYSSEEQNGLDLVGFKALPSGYRAPVSNDSVIFYGKKSWTMFWSNTYNEDNTNIYSLDLSPYNPSTVRMDGYGAAYSSKNWGKSIRLIKE
jgi:uncharacterized protein (TIGR02145 family)